VEGEGKGRGWEEGEGGMRPILYPDFGGIEAPDHVVMFVLLHQFIIIINLFAKAGCQ